MRRARALLVLAAAALALAAPASARGADVGRFDLGSVRLPDADGEHVSAALRGVIGVPDQPGARPLVLVLHGRHAPYCLGAGDDPERWPCVRGRERRHDVGFGYLVEALAARGFVAIALDLDAAYATGGAEGSTDRSVTLADALLARVGEASRGERGGFGVPLSGRMDLSRVAVVGHSRGALAALTLAANRAQVRSLLLVAPPHTTSPKPPADVAVAVVLPACDGDLVLLDGARYYDDLRLERDRRALTALVYVKGANHNFFNSVLADEADRTKAGCRRAGDRLTPSDQRSFLAPYATAFAAATLAGAPASGAAGLSPAARAPRTAFGADVVTSLVAPGARLVVQAPTGPEAAETDALGGAVATEGPVLVSVCTGDGAEGLCRPGLFQPSTPPELRLTWLGAGALVNEIPRAHEDARAFAAVHLRVAVDPTAALNAPGRRQALALRLRDRRGHSATVRIPGREPALAYPAGSFDPDSLSGVVVPGSVRIPLARFRGVDLGRLASLDLVVGETGRGALLVTDLELVGRSRRAQTARAAASAVSSSSVSPSSPE
jgi:dienelactone hydrolase